MYRDIFLEQESTCDPKDMPERSRLLCHKQWSKESGMLTRVKSFGKDIGKIPSKAQAYLVARKRSGAPSDESFCINSGCRGSYQDSK